MHRTQRRRETKHSFQSGSYRENDNRVRGGEHNAQRPIGTRVERRELRSSSLGDRLCDLRVSMRVRVSGKVGGRVCE